MLNDGSIAEMKTGEGKTLVSTLAAYLNALTGEGVHGKCIINGCSCKPNGETVASSFMFFPLVTFMTSLCTLDIRL